MKMRFWKKLTRGGFTLAELLIVVAILAILVAIAVPIFSNSLEKSREAVHRSNARTLKVLAIHELLTNDALSDVLINGPCWCVSAKYDFASEKFVTISIISAPYLSEMLVNGKSRSDIGKEKTSGEAEYTVYFTQQDVSVNT